MIKSAQSGDDQNLALLVYRTTRISSDIPSPAELLNSRKYSALLPTRARLLKEGERERLLELQSKQKEYYDRTAKDLPEIHAGTEVYVQLNPESQDWSKATVLSSDNNRHYKIRLHHNNKDYVRNRKFIRVPQPMAIQRKSTRHSKPPERYGFSA